MAGEAYRQAVAAHFGVGVTETMAISYLCTRGELGQTELANLLGRTTSSVTSLIDRLEAVGFVERASHPEDRRRAIVRLTGRGHEVLAISQHWFEAAFHQIPAAQLPTAVTLLETLTAGLRDSTATIPADIATAGADSVSAEA
nr:MarR family transcriptional regulator [Microlunatus panaciterrae]